MLCQVAGCAGRSVFRKGPQLGVLAERKAADSRSDVPSGGGTRSEAAGTAAVLKSESVCVQNLGFEEPRPRQALAISIGQFGLAPVRRLLWRPAAVLRE
jgi:hypothetical protein